MKEKVQDYPDLIKVDKAYVINTNEEKYRAALLRKKTNKQLGTIEQRLDALENNIAIILALLQGEIE